MRLNIYTSRSMIPTEPTTMNAVEEQVKRVLFVCVENSNRSQMAEAFARKHGGDKVEAFSAGSRPSGKVNPRAIQFMTGLWREFYQIVGYPAASWAPRGARRTWGAPDEVAGT